LVDQTPRKKGFVFKEGDAFEGRQRREVGTPKAFLGGTLQKALILKLLFPRKRLTGSEKSIKGKNTGERGAPQRSEGTSLELLSKNSVRKDLTSGLRGVPGGEKTLLRVASFP